MKEAKNQKPYAILVRTSREFKGRERISSKDQIEDAQRLAETGGGALSGSELAVLLSGGCHLYQPGIV
jgi:hypothetical protein